MRFINPLDVKSPSSIAVALPPPPPPDPLEAAVIRPCASTVISAAVYEPAVTVVLASSSGPTTSLSIDQVAPLLETVMSPLSPSLILPPPPEEAIVIALVADPVCVVVVVRVIPVPAISSISSSPDATRVVCPETYQVLNALPKSTKATPLPRSVTLKPVFLSNCSSVILVAVTSTVPPLP